MSDTIVRLNAALQGRYSIERELGEGGMATVYLAADLKHERRVALKVLKPELAAVVGADRFLAEIKTTANLQHPHILPLFDSGEADGFLFYVMPFVEGESLRERLEREHQLPVDDALAIATSMAEALDYAHRQGVVHRDIKPANVLMQDGKPVVSDFGIALAVGAGGGGRLTETGLSLGTPHYMSPEQATGDQRIAPATDIYALGCVLYEMLVGEPPHTGGSVQAILGRIITSDPRPIRETRSAVPTHVAEAVEKALERVPADRFGTAAAFVAAMRDESFRHGAPSRPAAASDRAWRPLAGVMSVAVLAVLAFGILDGRSPPPHPAGVFEITFRAGQEPPRFSVTSFDVSDDGSIVVYRGPGPGFERRQLWLRYLDDLDPVPVPGTAGGGNPSISPDNEWLAFGRDGAVHTVPIQGGRPTRLVEGSFATWGPDGYIYVRVVEGVGRVPISGGELELVTREREGEVSQQVFWYLPGNRALLHVNKEGFEWETWGLDLETGDRRKIGNGSPIGYTPSGHLVTVTEAGGSLMATPLDLESMQLTGSSVEVYSEVLYAYMGESGALVYVSSPLGDRPTELVWVDRDGTVERVEGGQVFNPGGSPTWRLSPDDSQIAYQLRTGGNYDAWIWSLEDETQDRLTSGTRTEGRPWWSPDGATIGFLSGAQVWTADVVSKTRGDEPVTEHSSRLTEASWGPDGRTLVAASGGDLFLFDGEPGATFRPLITSSFQESGPVISPDGKWVAFSSDATGSPGEVYVHSFPDVDRVRVTVSTEGGVRPLWSDDGTELFFIDGQRRMVATRFAADTGFDVTAREVLFEIPPDFEVSVGSQIYDVTSDGQRFLMGRAARLDGERSQRLILVQDVFAVVETLTGG